jgi:hypothetical protein
LLLIAKVFHVRDVRLVWRVVVVTVVAYLFRHRQRRKFQPKPVLVGFGHDVGFCPVA